MVVLAPYFALKAPGQNAGGSVCSWNAKDGTYCTLLNSFVNFKRNRSRRLECMHFCVSATSAPCSCKTMTFYTELVCFLRAKFSILKMVLH